MTDKQGPGAGHNSSLTDDHRTLFFSHFGKIKKLKEKMASASGELRSAYKLAKSEGFNKKELDRAFTLEKADEDELIEQSKRDAIIARWLLHPLGKQVYMFEEFSAADDMPAEDRAYEMGRVAGLKGETCQPPHDASTPQGQKWMEGWHVGAKEMGDLKTPLLTRDGKPKDSTPKGSQKGGRRTAKEALQPASAATDQMRADDKGEPAKPGPVRQRKTKVVDDYDSDFKRRNGLDKVDQDAEQQAGAEALASALPGLGDKPGTFKVN